MVSQKNVQTVKEVSEQMKQYPVIGILDMFKLPASQLHQIRTMLRGKAIIRMVKKRLIVLAIKDAGLAGADRLVEMLQGEPALLLSELDPFKLARIVDENKSEALAKEGDIAPKDILVTAGPTSLPPGPVIGEFQKAKIPASIEGDKIHIRQDTLVAKEGDEIDAILSGILAKLGITPMQIGLNLIAAWEKGTIYGQDILFIPREKYISDLVEAHQNAFNLAIKSGYYTKETLPLLLARAHQDAFHLAMSADILTDETSKALLTKGHAQAEALKSKAGVTGEPKPAQEAQEKPEEPEGEAKSEEETKPEKEEKPEEKPEEKEKPEKKDGAEETPEKKDS